MDPAAIALVIMLSGWEDAGGARGNAIDHLAGFTSMAKCESAGAKISKISFNPGGTKTVCLPVATEAADPSGHTTMVVFLSGWVNGLGSGARGNAVDHLSGFDSADACEKAASKLRDAAVSKDVVRTVCLER